MQRGKASLWDRYILYHSYASELPFLLFVVLFLLNMSWVYAGLPDLDEGGFLFFVVRAVGAYFISTYITGWMAVRDAVIKELERTKRK